MINRFEILLQIEIAFAQSEACAQGKVPTRFFEIREKFLIFFRSICVTTLHKMRFCENKVGGSGFGLSVKVFDKIATGGDG